MGGARCGYGRWAPTPCCSRSTTRPAWFAELSRRRAAGELAAADIVPGARTVLLDGAGRPGRHRRSGCGPGRPPPADAAATADWSTSRSTLRRAGPRRRAPSSGRPVGRGVIERLGDDRRSRVAFCGFAPGFGLPDRAAGRSWRCPGWRRPGRGCRPDRSGWPTRTPASTRRASPGGWRLVGRTDARCSTPDRRPAGAAHPGHPGRGSWPRGRTGDGDRGRPARACSPPCRTSAGPGTRTSASPGRARSTRPRCGWPTGWSATPTAPPAWRPR